MASQSPPPSSLPTSMGPGARPIQPGEGTSLLKELTDIRSSYSINVDSDAIRLGYSFRGQNRRYDIPFTAMPVSDTGRWFLYGGIRRARVTGLLTLDLIRGAENMAGRPLTQAEAEGFAFHAGKKMRYNFLGTLSGFGVGYLIAIRTWKTMKFPFMKPKPIEAYDYFPAQRLAILKGGYSRIMWQITRANIYAAISLILAQTIFGSMGDTVMTVGLYRDTRTQEIVKAMKGGFDRIRINRSQPGQPAPVPQQAQGYGQDSQNEDFYGNEGRGIQDYYGKSSNDSGDQTFTDGTTDTGTLDDSTMKQREKERDDPRPQYSPPRRSTTSTARKADSDFFFDDASPTAGNDADASTPKAYQPTSGGGGSVWDRIRRGGRPQPQPTPKSTQTENSRSSGQVGGWQRQSAQNYENKGDSFSFSNSEEERQLAKDQAQKDFDAMLERERKQGGSEGYAASSYAADTGMETPPASSGSAWDRRRRGGS